MCIWLAPAAAWAQSEQHQHGGMAPKDIGTVSFETSCSPAVKTQFNEAVALLHSFWFAESRAIFESVLKTDPNCAMSYWGIALTHWGNPFAGQRSPQTIANGKAAIDKGARHRIADTAREGLHRRGRDPVFEQRRDDAAPARARLREGDGAPVGGQQGRRRGAHLLGAGGRAGRVADRQDLRAQSAGGRNARADDQADAEAPRHRALHHSRLRRAGAGAEGAARRAQLRRHRARRAARAPHAVAHVHARRLLEGIRRQQRQVGRHRREDQWHRRGDARARLHDLCLPADGHGHAGARRTSTTRCGSRR